MIKEKKDFGMNNNWKNLQSIDQLEQLINDSHDKPVAIFKHSTRCSISSMAMDRLQRQWDDAEASEMDFYYLDLISHRDVSNEIAQKLEVMHQSPQVIVIKNGKASYHNSHMGISYKDLISQIK